MLSRPARFQPAQPPAKLSDQAAENGGIQQHALPPPHRQKAGLGALLSAQAAERGPAAAHGPAGRAGRPGSVCGAGKTSEIHLPSPQRNQRDHFDILNVLFYSCVVSWKELFNLVVIKDSKLKGFIVICAKDTGYLLAIKSSVPGSANSAIYTQESKLRKKKIWRLVKLCK